MQSDPNFKRGPTSGDPSARTPFLLGKGSHVGKHNGNGETAVERTGTNDRDADHGATGAFQNGAKRIKTPTNEKSHRLRIQMAQINPLVQREYT